MRSRESEKPAGMYMTGVAGSIVKDARLTLGLGAKLAAVAALILGGSVGALRAQTNPINFVNFSAYTGNQIPITSPLALSNGITMSFGWQIQAMNDVTSPSGSTESISCSAGASIRFQGSPVIVRSFVAMQNQFGNRIRVLGRRNGLAVWTYDNPTAGQWNWVRITSGAGKLIDELNFPEGWGQRYTDFYIQDAAGPTPPTNGPASYYVDGSNPLAKNLNPGTEAEPWKTLQQAADLLLAGDTVLIKAGTYTGDVHAGSSGTSAGWITYRAYPGAEQQVVLDHAAFYLEQKSFIKVSGLKVRYAPHAGIAITGPGGNYVISGNYTYDTGSSGIAVWGVPWTQDPGRYAFKAITNVIVENNIIDKACDGGWNEMLTIANGVDSFVVRSNILRNGTNAVNGGEGIDLKEGASNGKVSGNQVFNIRRYGIYLDAGASDPTYYPTPALLTNIEVFNNLVHNNDAHGIGVTSEGRGNLDGIRIFNNLCYSNGADGILLYHYPNTTNYARNIGIINNTTYRNGTIQNWYGGIATDHDTAENVVVRNNIAYANPGFQIKPPWNPATVMDHNLTTADPRFRNPAAADFHLQSSSPAIDGGSATGAPAIDLDGSARPYGAAVDIGAFEYIPAAPPRLQLQRSPAQQNPGLSLEGGPQSHYQVEWTTALVPADWNLLQDIPSLPWSPYPVFDPDPISSQPQRYYRAVLIH